MIDYPPGRVGAKCADSVQSKVFVSIVDEWEDIFVAFEPGFAECPDSSLPQFISFETRISDNAVELFAGKGIVAKLGEDEYSFHAQLGPVIIVPDEMGDLFLSELGAESGGGACRFQRAAAEPAASRATRSSGSRRIKSSSAGTT